MKVSKFGVKWPVTTAMIFLAFIILGGFAYTMVGLDLMPDFEVPVISIITLYDGAGPKEVESRITEQIEDQVSTVQNVDEVMSMSMEGISIVSVKFNWGIDMAEASNDIRDKLDLVAKRLPEAAETPTLFKFDTSMIPIIVMGVTAEESWPKLDNIIDKKIVDPLKRVPGVATALVQGGKKRGILCQLIRERVEATGLSGRRIVETLRAQNLNNPGGHIRTGKMDYLIRTPEEFSSVDQIGEVVVANQPGIVKLKDVAEIVDGFLEKTDEFLINGKPAFGVIIQKQSGANSVSVSDSLRKVLPKIQETLPNDVKMHLFFDTSDFIRNTINNLKSSVLFGGIGVFFVILFFLRDFRASVVVCITIPTSLIITFLLMYMKDYTLNQISLSSLAIAIGMVVDNAIVILDNIKRYLERGVNSRESAAWGASEMSGAVMASTMTTIAIFLPIMFTSGITEIMFGQLANIVTMALIASFISAVMLTPMLSSRILKPATREQIKNKKKQTDIITRLESIYVPTLEYCLNNRLKVTAGLVIMFIASFGAMQLVGTEFMPKQDQGRLIINIEAPTGTRFEETGRICQMVLKTVEEQFGKDVEATVTRYGANRDGFAAAILGTGSGSNVGQVELRLTSKNERSETVSQMVERIRPHIEKIPGAIVRFDSSDPLANMLGAGSSDFLLHIYGYDLETAMNYTNAVVAKIENISGLKDIEVSQKLAKPELQVNIDRAKASDQGLNVADVATTVELYMSGDTSVKYRESGEEYDIEVRLRPEDRDKISDLAQLMIPTPLGNHIRLENIAEIKQRTGPTEISRSDQERYIKVSAQVYGRDPGSVVAEAEKLIRAIPVPPGFSWKFAGNEEERRESFFLMLQAAMLGMILVYMVMASQFESLLAPFIIFLSIPFGFMGATLMLAITGFRISVVSLLGFIILIGIAVNNGIVLVSYINILVQRGKPLHEALLEAGRSRLRPVLCTTITTIIGMSPMALSTGEGSEVWVPLSLSVIGGLVVSTLMTLILMPILYSFFSRRLFKALGVK